MALQNLQMLNHYMVNDWKKEIIHQHYQQVWSTASLDKHKLKWAYFSIYFGPKQAWSWLPIFLSSDKLDNCTCRLTPRKCFQKHLRLTYSAAHCAKLQLKASKFTYWLPCVRPIPWLTDVYELTNITPFGQLLLNFFGRFFHSLELLRIFWVVLTIVLVLLVKKIQFERV